MKMNNYQTVLQLGMSVFVVLLSLAGCSVQPWERGNLARPEMAIVPNAQQAAFREHVFESKEAASGGITGSGGGCGCN